MKRWVRETVEPRPTTGLHECCFLFPTRCVLRSKRVKRWVGGIVELRPTTSFYEYCFFLLIFPTRFFFAYLARGLRIGSEELSSSGQLRTSTFMFFFHYFPPYFLLRIVRIKRVPQRSCARMPYHRHTPPHRQADFTAPWIGPARPPLDPHPTQSDR